MDCVGMGTACAGAVDMTGRGVLVGVTGVFVGEIELGSAVKSEPHAESNITIANMMTAK